METGTQPGGSARTIAPNATAPPHPCSPPDVLKHLGVDRSVVLAAAGIDPKRLQEPESSISYAAMGQLLTRCVALSRCPHFGLLVGARQGLSSLGVVGFLVQHSPDVGTGLKNLVAHMHHFQRGAVAV